MSCVLSVRWRKMKDKIKFWNKCTIIGAIIGFIFVIYPYILFPFISSSKIITSIVSNSLTTILLTLWSNIPGFRCGSDGCESGFFLAVILVPLFFVVVGALIGFLIYTFKTKRK